VNNNNNNILRNNITLLSTAPSIIGVQHLNTTDSPNFNTHIIDSSNYKPPSNNNHHAIDDDDDDDDDTNIDSTLLDDSYNLLHAHNLHHTTSEQLYIPPIGQ